MGDPRVQERDNPLVRRLNAVADINRDAGAALGGGARPPRPTPNGPVQGGSATVLPPPAIPLTADEAMGDALPPAEVAELERRWAEDPTNPANKAKAMLVASPDGAVEEVPISDVRKVTVPLKEWSVVNKKDYVGLIEALPLTDEQKQQVKLWVFEGAAKEMMLETARRMDEMQIAFGLAPAKEEAKVERRVEAKVATEQPAARKRGRRKKGTAVAGRRKKAAPQGQSTE